MTHQHNQTGQSQPNASPQSLKELQTEAKAKEDNASAEAQKDKAAAAQNDAYKKALSDIGGDVAQFKKDGPALIAKWKKLTSTYTVLWNEILAGLGKDKADEVAAALKDVDAQTDNVRVSIGKLNGHLQGSDEEDAYKQQQAADAANSLYQAYRSKSLDDRAKTVEGLLKDAAPKDNTYQDLARQYTLLFVANDWITVVRATDGSKAGDFTFPELGNYESTIVSRFTEAAKAADAANKSRLDWEGDKSKLANSTTELKSRISKRKDNLIAAANALSLNGSSAPAAGAARVTV